MTCNVLTEFQLFRNNFSAVTLMGLSCLPILGCFQGRQTVFSSPPLSSPESQPTMHPPLKSEERKKYITCLFTKVFYPTFSRFVVANQIMCLHVNRYQHILK